MRTVKALLDFNNRLDHTGFGFRVGFEMIDHFIKGCMVRDPGLGIDLTFLDQPDDPLEISRQGIAGCQHRQFLGVHQRLAKVDLVSGNPDVHELARVGHVVEGMGHGTGITCGVDDDCG